MIPTIANTVRPYSSYLLLVENWWQEVATRIMEDQVKCGPCHPGPYRFVGAFTYKHA
jgi:hypothetical protein